MVIQVYAPNSNAEEAEVEQFYEDLQDLMELTPKIDIIYIIGDWNAKVGHQELPGVTGIFGTYHTVEFIFQCPVFLLFHTVHGVLKARILKWFDIPFSSVHILSELSTCDPSILVDPTRHGS